VAKHTFSTIAQFAWRRVVTMVRVRHRWKWPDVRRWLIDPTGRWQQPATDGIALFNMATVTVTRYRYRGRKIPNPWVQPVNA
jgi:RNA-directed DNA polymerase